jgi:prepilin-type N-terminal cleavage/methylation domain-containing protein
MIGMNSTAKRLQAAPAGDLARSRQYSTGAPNGTVGSAAGFTLLEITIALAMLGLILSALYGSYRAVTDSILGLQPQTALDQKGQFFVQQLSRQVRCCYGGRLNRLSRPVPREDLAAKDLEGRLPLFRGGPTSIDESLLRYVTSGGTRSQRTYPGCLIVVCYKLDTWRHVLLVREELYGRRDEEAQEDWRVVLEDVLEIEFEYFDGKDWQSEWDSRKSGSLPRAMRVRLVLESRQGRHADLASVIPILCSGPRTSGVPVREIPAGTNRRNE